MFQRREREQRPSSEKSGEFSGAGRQSQWNHSQQGTDYQEEGRESRHFTSHGQPAGRDSYSQQRRADTGGRGGQSWYPANQGGRGKQYFESSQSSQSQVGGARYEEEDSYQYESQGSQGDWEEEEEVEEVETPRDTRRSVENVKSAGDRRMERELGSGIIKNPFDPSNRIGGRQK